MRTLLVFVDGVGIGELDDTRNAFVAAPPPVITQLLDGALVAAQTDVLQARDASLVPLDARLGVTGLPQSGTGQYSLFTGQNGARLFGRHFGPWVPTSLREPLQHNNVLTRARNRGSSIAFANAYPEELLEAASAGGTFRAIGPLRAGPPLMAAGAGVLDRHTDALQRGHAVSSEITNEGWREHLQRTNLPRIDARQAGANLATIANQHEFTVFAHYSTDAVGHQKDLAAAVAALHLVDDFLAGILDHLDHDVRMVVASDHGNLEDASAGHTLHPAFGLIVGADHATFARPLHGITDLADAVTQ